MSIWLRRLAPAAAFAVAVAFYDAAAAQPLPATRPGPPLMSLDGNSELGLNLQSPPPVADPGGDPAAAGKVKIEEPPRPPVDPKAGR